MDEKSFAVAEGLLDVSKEAVWKALTTPESIKEYMFGADVKSDWKVGSPITWSGEFKGKSYEDKGEILEFDKGNKLAYSHFSPLSRMPDKPENYHTVTITLSGANQNKTNVRLEQDNNANEEAKAESEKNWNTMLDGLKKHVEESRSSTARGGA